MNKFNELAAQAKAKAEQGRISANAQINSLNSKRSSGSAPLGSSSASSLATAAVSPPPPPSRARAPSSTTSGVDSSKGVFVEMPALERQAFFSLLDEYFQSRPQYRDIFDKSNHVSRSVSVPLHEITQKSATAPEMQSAQALHVSPVRVADTNIFGTARALYDFESSELEDLPFREGEYIVIFEHVSDDWWKGELRGRSGIFPKAYVEMTQ